MMLKQILPALALVLAFIMISPGMFAATLDESEILVDMESSHADEYDELNNLAGNATHSNYETWNPVPNGIWIGADTEESLYRLNMVTSNNSIFTMTWAVRFSSSQIMNGASQFTVRLPIYVDSYVTGVSLSILASDTVDSHDLVANAPVWNTSASLDYIYVKDFFDPADVSVVDGNDVFTRNNRMYVSITAPILAEQIYVFVMAVTYGPDGNPSFYISPNDVATDQIINSWFGWRIPTGPGVYSTGEERFDIDWGASYDMKGGLGNGVTSIQLYMNKGDELWFTLWAPYVLGVNGHHTIAIPFYTSNGSAQFNVTVTQRSVGGPDVLTNTSEGWYDQMIMVSNDAAVNATGATSFHKQFTVNLTSCTGQWITFYFKNGLLDNPGVTLNGTKYTMLNPDLSDPYVNDAELFIGFTPICSYLVCSEKIVTPVMGSVVEPTEVEAESFFGKGILKGLYMFWVKVNQYGEEFRAKTFDVQTEGEYVAYALSMLSGGGVGVAWWVVSALTDLPTPIDVYRQVKGFVDNVLDMVWDALKAIGNFLWSIGEYIYDALTWLADQIVEYGAYLLGLLIIAAGLLIFFFPIHYQLKLWTSALLLAQGKIAQAQAGVEEVASDIKGKAGKIGGML